MVHSFLFQEGLWKAEGTLIDKDGNSSDVKGEVHIQHKNNVWINEGHVKSTEPSFNEIHNRYEISPFENGKDDTSWFSINPVLGHLMGHMVIAGDSILSSFSSEDNIFKGFEFLLQVETDTYINRGVLFREGERYSTWLVTLRRR